MARQGKARVLTLPEFKQAEKAALLTKHPYKEADMPDKQAEAQSAALIELFDYQAATKKDLKETESQLNLKFDNKIAEVEIKIAEIKAEIIKWMVGLFFAQSALFISFLKIFH